MNNKIIKNFLQYLVFSPTKSTGLVASSCRKDLKIIKEMVVNEIKEEYNCSFSIREHEIQITVNESTVSEGITISFEVINDQDSVRGLSGICSILEFNLSIPSTVLLRNAIRNADCKIFIMEKN